MASKVYYSTGETKAFSGESCFTDPKFAVFDVAFREWGEFPGADDKFIVVNTEDETASVVSILGAGGAALVEL